MGTCSVATAGPSTGTGSRCWVLHSSFLLPAGVSVVAMSIVVLGSTPSSTGSRSKVNCSPGAKIKGSRWATMRSESAGAAGAAQRAMACSCEP